MGSEMSFNAIRLDEVQSSKISIGKSKFNKKSLIQAKMADTLKSGQFLRLSNQDGLHVSSEDVNFRDDDQNYTLLS